MDLGSSNLLGGYKERIRVESSLRIDADRLRAISQTRLDQVSKAASNENLKTSFVKAKVLENYLKVGIGDGHTIVCDEDPSMGGTNLGPRPLQYFLAGLAFCELTIYTQYAAVMRIPLQRLELDVRGLFDIRGKYGVENKFPGFQEIQLELRIDSEENKERIMKLVDTVHERCPAYNTLKGNVTFKGKVIHNGVQINTFEMAPTILA